MAETDGFVREPHGPDPDEDGAPMGGDHRIDIAGDASGTVIAGNHNVVIDAHGSTVNLLPPQERPRPVRRERVALVPRRQREPVGREADLEELENALRGHGVVQLWGPPGVGKSTLLRHAARSLEPGPDGVLFLNGAHREPEDLAQEIFEACYEAPGYAPTGPELRRLMTGIEVTVYVDDAELTPERLRLLADAAPDATFVFASRERSLLGESADLELRGWAARPDSGCWSGSCGTACPRPSTPWPWSCARWRWAAPCCCCAPPDWPGWTRRERSGCPGRPRSTGCCPCCSTASTRRP